MALSPEQKQAAELIAQGHKFVLIAKRLNIDRSLLHIWLRNQEFKELVSKNETEILDETRRQFTELAEAAMAAYRGILESWEEMPASAARVATTILKNAGIIRESAVDTTSHEEVTVKLAELKAPPNARD